jgi:predicted RND superfamily exporter protein
MNGAPEAAGISIRPAAVGRFLSYLVVVSVTYPRAVIALTVVLTLGFAAQLPHAKIDTDPKHMLPVTSPVRAYNDRMEKEFALHPDVIVLGIVNEQGIANPQTLARIVELTQRIQAMPGVIARDVESFSTIDNVKTGADGLTVGPILDRIPQTQAQLEAFRGAVLGNPLFINRIIDPEATTTAIYVPIEPMANGKEIADRIRTLVASDRTGNQYFLAGDPVTRDTFGTEMFRQMALFSPIAGLVMCVALWMMFRSWPLIVANMGAATVGIFWCMGLLVSVGYPVHIMSSMSPVFLMAIATDSVHIFNEFVFQFSETRDKRRAVLQAMAAVGAPVFYSDLTTAAGFAALGTATIVPVKVFGLFVAFGTIVIMLMSFTLIPAIMILLREKQIPEVRTAVNTGTPAAEGLLTRLGDFSVRHAGFVALAGALLLAAAVAGLFHIRVNNNMVDWFRPDSSVRVADRVMNQRLGGTSTGYLVIESPVEGAMKEPAMLRGIEGLQGALEKDPLVGKSLSVVDYVKRINRVLHDDDPAFDRLPESRTQIGQYLFLLGTAIKPADLDNVVDYGFKKANLIVQLKSWDADTMREIIGRAQAYLGAHPLPNGATLRPAGIAYFNLVWSDQVLWGMLESFATGLVAVLALLVIETGSLRWGSLAFVPLLFTVTLIYGAVGWAGKDFDMPIAVISTLSLGMAVDFAIHFVSRFRQRYREHPNLREALVWTVARPGRGILLNAALFALGFAVMVFAALTPYITVGALMVAIMLLSALATIVYLPGLILLFRRGLIGGTA